MSIILHIQGGIGHPGDIGDLGTKGKKVKSFVYMVI